MCHKIIGLEVRYTHTLVKGIWHISKFLLKMKFKFIVI